MAVSTKHTVWLGCTSQVLGQRIRSIIEITTVKTTLGVICDKRLQHKIPRTPRRRINVMDSRARTTTSKADVGKESFMPTVKPTASSTTTLKQKRMPLTVKRPNGCTVNSLDSISTMKAANAIAGSLGWTSKMGCWSYGLPAKRCQVGSVLHKLDNTVCSKCYALKGNYRFDNIQAGLERRWRSITDPRWVEALTFMIRHRKCEYFRWHDSGDIQSLDHLEKIADVAVRCSTTRFWIPTREKDYVHAFQRKHGAFPKNLIVRVSGAMIDGPPPAGFANTSTVVTSGATCPAHLQNNQCGPCRACWDPRRKSVSYKKH